MSTLSVFDLTADELTLLHHLRTHDTALMDALTAALETRAAACGLSVEQYVAQQATLDAEAREREWTAVRAMLNLRRELD